MNLFKNIFNPKRGYFNKLLTTLLLTFVVVGIAVVGIFISQSRNALEREMDLIYKSRNLSYAQKLDDRFKVAFSVIEKYRNEPEFIRLALAENIEAAELMDTFAKVSSDRHILESMGVSVGVIHPKLKTSIFTDGFNNLDIDALSINTQNLSLVNYSFIETNGVIPLLDGKKQEGAVFAINQRYAGENQLIFVFIIYNNAYSVISKSENYVMTYGKSIALSAYSDFKNSPSLFDIESNGKYSENGLTTYAYQSSEIMAVKYYYCVRNDAVLFMISHNWLFLFFVMIGVSFMLAYVASSRLYRPIGQVVTSMQRINNAEYVDEIKYLSDSTSLMFDSIKELSNKNEQQNDIIRIRIISDICIGVMTRDEATHYVSEYSLSLLKGEHRVIIFEIYNYTDLAELYDRDTCKSIKHDVLAMFTGELKASYSFESEYNKFVIIAKCSNDGDGIQRLTEKLESVCQSIELMDNISVIAAVGNNASDFTQTEGSYHDALYVLDNCFFTGDTFVYTMDDVGTKQKFSIYYPLEIEHQIIENMVNSRQSHAISLIEKIIDLNVNQGMAKQKQTEMKFLLISTINRILNSINQNADSIFKEDTILYLEMTADNETEFKTKIIEVFEKLGDSLPSEQAGKNGQIVKLVEFIDANLDKDISLSDLAELLNLSPWYVSRLFKNVLKQSFKFYVNQRRVELAKRIMSENSEITISELALKVGCNNTVTFNRMFQKHTGMSPGKFRSVKETE